MVDDTGGSGMEHGEGSGEFGIESKQRHGQRKGRDCTELTGT
jgi:hypothetical protein